MNVRYVQKLMTLNDLELSKRVIQIDVTFTFICVMCFGIFNNT